MTPDAVQRSQHRGIRERYQHYAALLLYCLSFLLLAACSTDGPSEVIRPLPTLRPTIAQMPSAPPPTNADQPSDTGWLDAGPGVELRQLRQGTSDTPIAITLVRLDPQRVYFQVGYNPEQPDFLEVWCSKTGALAGINGGFFDADYRSTALVISGGVATGESYQNRGGMFAVDQAGGVSLRYLAEQPYDPNEPLSEAMQGWPMLIKPGGSLTYTHNDTELARRSAIALDRSGRVLLIVVPTSSFTLRGLADWLLASDLEIDAALNLDGGSSTGLCLHSGGRNEQIKAFVALPQVLLALPK